MSKKSKSRQNGGDLTTGAVECSHPLLPPALVKEARALYDHFNTDATEGHQGMNSAELREAMRAMGLEYTENQVKDLIFNISQSPAVRSRNKQSQTQKNTLSTLKALPEKEKPVADGSCLTVPGGAPSEAPSRTAKSMRSGRSATEQAGDDKMFLSFEQFIELLTTTLEDCDQTQELEAAFQVMDIDKDGAIGAADLKAMLKQLGSEHFHDEEIQEMLNEADWNDDRQVTFDDFRNVLDTN